MDYRELFCKAGVSSSSFHSSSPHFVVMFTTLLTLLQHHISPLLLKILSERPPLLLTVADPDRPALELSLWDESKAIPLQSIVAILNAFSCRS
jgi:hypothetical protein